MRKQVPEATVLAVGPGGRDRDGKIIPMEFKTGDKVLLPSYGGQSIKVGDDEYHLFRDAEIWPNLHRQTTQSQQFNLKISLITPSCSTLSSLSDTSKSPHSTLPLPIQEC
ncbi:hypothetical protein H4Q26_003150 [Puccinia striiformis f. sp. tritici PST-130]|nr:hypothetical protein H4Q26_003150 [Puccinia striiformis f. sp. tritici PST-130]